MKWIHLQRGLACALLAVLGTPACAQPHSSRDPIEVEVSRSYELANIILALTPYGRRDDWEVLKDTPYHREVLAFFEPCRHHPLLAEVDYSRDRWEEYLAFRSDAYAFEDRGGHVLERTSAFRTSAVVLPFDDHLALVADFARSCRFEEFYAAHAAFYARVAAAYREAYLFPQMLAFLRREFGEARATGRYIVVLSPLVGRMNAQRRLGTDQLSFVSPARGLLEGDGAALPENDRIVEVHTLFTEIDHAFVNPVSDGLRRRIDASFDWRAWGARSGYDSNYEAFNEYMTWGAYDLFVREQFGRRAEPAIANWHIQNKSRGFVASELFAAKLAELRETRASTIREAFPLLLDWAARAQQALAVPVLVRRRWVRDGEVIRVLLAFSVPMQAPSRVVTRQILRDGDGKPRAGEFITLTGPGHRLRWSADGRTLEFELPAAADLVGLSLSGWGGTPLQGTNGLYLEPGSKLHFEVSTAARD